ncbi:MAG: UDP-3-O-[3-hydroxymyristoyl] N-acetylglucosamine deacetylase [Phormidesmis priestleyi]|uniref:UDP-3-O-acyl-N-acetylglucosamine deacetylase n=1 Tax=Phormidesmis priestleyi TaxID=268141 RepID=A0A2W4ZC35_9CYAN|nr:MAG: UDP-3-O-[3-hydroxymyristoyl] N-acetylglucosamine deacetylase [Phormidesmis priestleyi]
MIDQRLAPQQTLAAEVRAAGVGLHLGQQTQVRLLPAEPEAGRYFVRTDLGPNLKSDSQSDVRADSADLLAEQRITADVGNVIKTQLSTELGVGNAQVRTVEHLLSALSAAAVDNVRIEIDGPELPLLDGSAQEWMAAIARSGISPQPVARKRRMAVTQPVTVQIEDAWVAAFPSSELRFTYGIDFALAAIGNQWHSWSAADSFETEIAPARTFGLAPQIDYLRAQGLIKGGSLENALVCGENGWINPPLRFANEPARHKLLDLIGDLSLLGDIPQAHYVAYKASHALHIKLAQQLAQSCPFLVSA